jgi:hypothetical protein
VDLRATKILEIHLDASKMDDFTEYRFATALTELHPRSDGTNPHGLHTIKFVVKGNILFTRYTYHLTSSVMSELVGDKLRMLVKGKLTEKEKAVLPYKINSTEKGLSKALLDIRGIRQVLFEGRGLMEADFEETLKSTLVQPPGTSVVEMSDPERSASTYRLNHEGEIASNAYGPKALRPYPTLPAFPEYNFEAVPEKNLYLVDEKAELAGEFSGLSERDARTAAIVKYSVPLSRRHIPTIDVGPVTKTRSQRRGTITVKNQGNGGQIQEKSEDEEDDSLGLKDMVRIKVKAEHPEDTGTGTVNWEVIDLILTNKAASVELGWKI